MSGVSTTAAAVAGRPAPAFSPTRFALSVRATRLHCLLLLQITAQGHLFSSLAMWAEHAGLAT